MKHMSHVRSRLFVAAAGVIALAGCAVPGQGAPAGTAAEYGDTVVTNAQVDETFSAWVKDTNGALVANRDEVLTLELLHDDLLAACDERGTPIRTSDAERLAKSWFEGLGVTAEPSEEFVHSLEAQFALTVLALDGGDDAINDIIESVKDGAIVSPRAGEVDVEAFLASVDNARATAEQEQLGAQSYIPFQHVNAFSDANASWLERG
jgi:hypothetical protein